MSDGARRPMDGKVAVVVGAGGTAIGQATARRLQRDGASVVVVDRSKDRQAAIELSAELALTDPPMFIEISDGSTYQAAFANVVERYGRIDSIANIAVGGRAPDPGDWEWTMRGSFAPAYFGTGYGAALMAASGGGSIVNLASVSGVVLSPSIQPLPRDLPSAAFPLPGAALSSYGASKASVVHFTREMAVLWGRRGVRVNVVAPGFMQTPFTLGNIGAQRRAEIEELIPLGVFGRAEDIAAAVAFFSSDDAGYINGQLLVVDGGFSARSS